MGFMDQMADLAAANRQMADVGQEDCIMCDGSTKDRDEVTGIAVHNECKADLAQAFADTASIEVSTLAPNGPFKVLTTVSKMASGKAYDTAYNAVTFKLKAEAHKVGASGVCGTQYQFRTAVNEGGNQVIEIMAFGTAVN